MEVNKKKVENNAFGSCVDRVKDLVDEAIRFGNFQGPVFGPIGDYCSVKPGKEEFASLVDVAIGANYDRFVVCNIADQKYFQGIREQAGCQDDCEVFVQPPSRRYSIPDPPQIDGIEPILTVIEVSNDLIFNCLVDQCQVEEKAFARTKEESESILLIRDNCGETSICGGVIREVFFLPNGDHWKFYDGGVLHMISNTKPLRRILGVGLPPQRQNQNHDFIHNIPVQKPAESTVAQAISITQSPSAKDSYQR